MSIYSKNGNQLNECFDLLRNSLNTAYNINGGIVFTKGISPSKTDYSTYQYTQIWRTDAFTSSGQSFAINDGNVFWFKGANNGQGDLYVVDQSDGTTILHTTDIVAGHANNACFGGYYNASDDFPLLYVGGASATMMTYVNRILDFDGTNFDSELIRTLTYPTEIAGSRYDATISESDPDVIVTAGYNYDEYSSTDLYAQFNVCWWDLGDLTANNDGTYTPTLINSIVTEAVYVNIRTSDNQVGVKQSVREHDGMIWIATGYNSVHGYIYAYNPTTGNVVHTIDLNTTSEVEGIEFMLENNAWVMYVGFMGGQMRRYTFGTL